MQAKATQQEAPTPDPEPAHVEPPVTEYMREYSWRLPPAVHSNPTAETGVTEADLDAAPALAVKVPFPRTEYQDKFEFAIPARGDWPIETAETDTDTADLEVTTAPIRLPVRQLPMESTTEYKSKYQAWASTEPKKHSSHGRRVNVGDAGSTIKHIAEYDPDEAPREVAVQASKTEQPKPPKIDYRTEYTAEYTDRTQPVSRQVPSDAAEGEAGQSEYVEAFTVPPEQLRYQKFQDWLSQLQELRAKANEYRARDRRATMDDRLQSLSRQQSVLLTQTKSRMDAATTRKPGKQPKTTQPSKSRQYEPHSNAGDATPAKAAAYTQYQTEPDHLAALVDDLPTPADHFNRYHPGDYEPVDSPPSPLEQLPLRYGDAEVMPVSHTHDLAATTLEHAKARRPHPRNIHTH